MFTLIRIIGFFMVMQLAWPNIKILGPIFYGVTLMHFLIGGYYSAPRLKTAMSGTAKFVLIPLLISSFFAPFLFTAVQNQLLFGIHYAMAEAYFGLRKFPQLTGRLVFLRSIFEYLSYCVMTFWQSFFAGYEPYWLIAMVLLLAAYLFELSRAKSLPGNKLRVDLFGCQLVTLALVSTCVFWLKIPEARSHLIIIFIHGVSWMFYPLQKNEFSVSSSVRNQFLFYIFSSLFVVGLFAFLSFNFKEFIPTAHYFYLSLFYLHIFLGFAASYAVPNVIHNFFNPISSKSR